jgi:hypothetical protein
VIFLGGVRYPLKTMNLGVFLIENLYQSDKRKGHAYNTDILVCPDVRFLLKITDINPKLKTKKMLKFILLIKHLLTDLKAYLNFFVQI